MEAGDFFVLPIKDEALFTTDGVSSARNRITPGQNEWTPDKNGDAAVEDEATPVENEHAAPKNEVAAVKNKGAPLENGRAVPKHGVTVMIPTAVGRGYPFRERREGESTWIL